MDATTAVTEHLDWARQVARRAARTLPPSVDIEDLEQIASIALMRCAESYSTTPGHGYERPTAFRVYAWRPVYYACLMEYRRRHYRDVTHEPLGETGGAAPDVESIVQRRRVLAALIEALGALPPLQAAVLSLHYLRGLTIAETARELSISEGWASQAHTAGLAALRAMLRGRGVESIEACL